MFRRSGARRRVRSCRRLSSAPRRGRQGLPGLSRGGFVPRECALQAERRLPTEYEAPSSSIYPVRKRPERSSPMLFCLAQRSWAIGWMPLSGAALVARREQSNTAPQIRHSQLCATVADHPRLGIALIFTPVRLRVIYRRDARFLLWTPRTGVFEYLSETQIGRQSPCSNFPNSSRAQRLPLAAKGIFGWNDKGTFGGRHATTKQSLARPSAGETGAGGRKQ